MTISLERVTRTAVDCPAWCDGAHDIRYETAGEAGERDHYREIGRLDDGDCQLVVGVAVTTDASGRALSPSVELLHLGNGGEPVEELLGGDVYLSSAEALALGPLLVQAAEVLRTGRAA